MAVVVKIPFGMEKFLPPLFQFIFIVSSVTFVSLFASRSIVTEQED